MKNGKDTELVLLDTGRYVPYTEYVGDGDINESVDEDFSDYWKYVRSVLQREYDDFKSNMKYCKLFPMVAVGYVGLWNGKVRGGKVLKDVDDLLGLFSSCDTIKIWQDTDGLHINGYHHDGTNRANIRIINERGKAWLEKHEGEVSSIVLGETMAKPCYSRSFPLGNKNQLF